jgi:predicted DNA-binding protein with PD1-like motif
MHQVPLRLAPGDDLRERLEALTREQAWPAAFVLAGVGSLQGASVRYAGQPQATRLVGEFEILSLCGSLSADGAHLHVSLSDSEGRVLGGHVCAGCIVRTTAELLVAVLPTHRFARHHDADTGYAELHITSDDDKTLLHR